MGVLISYKWLFLILFFKLLQSIFPFLNWIDMKQCNFDSFIILFSAILHPNYGIAIILWLYSIFHYKTKSCSLYHCCLKSNNSKCQMFQLILIYLSIKIIYYYLIFNIVFISCFCFFTLLY